MSSFGRPTSRAIKNRYADGSICKRCFLLWTRTREMSAYVTLGYRVFDFKIRYSQIGGGITL
jgi:hypothetical protein